MASIYTYDTAEPLAEDLQGSSVCDDAIRSAREMAAERGEDVVLEDDDGVWLIQPDGGCEELEKDWHGQ